MGLVINNLGRPETHQARRLLNLQTYKINLAATRRRSTLDWLIVYTLLFNHNASLASLKFLKFCKSRNLIFLGKPKFDLSPRSQITDSYTSQAPRTVCFHNALEHQP